MRFVTVFLLFGLLLGCVVTAAADDSDSINRYSLWIGSHYTDFKDYRAKVGEYRLSNEDVLPEFKLSVLSAREDQVFRFDGHYFDYENIDAALTTKAGDKFKLQSAYTSLTKQEGRDLLENIAAREWLGTGPGGKILTHKLNDDGVNYSTHRQQIDSKAEVQLSRTGDIRMIAAHRFIGEDGTAQSISNNHCFSCHLESNSVKVKNRTHQVIAGLRGTAKDQNAEYKISYRKFKSDAAPGTFFFDKAQHPVNGSAAAEFGSRLIFNDVTLPTNVLPETEKVAHKFSLKGAFGPGRYAAAFTYSRSENRFTNQYVNTDKLVSKAYGGHVNYSMLLDPRTRLIAKLSGNRIKNDNPFIDLPSFREGATSGPVVSFDYIRLSELDRKTFDASAELIYRATPKVTLSFLGGYDYILRYDYPERDSKEASKKMIGQVKAKYRQGMKYTLRGKYRFEKTADPFTSARGLFEYRGREVWARPAPAPYTFYYQREDLRYQNITTVPTDYHEVDLRAEYRPTMKSTLTLGFKGIFDKNGDLDSLDVKHSSFQPSVNLTVIPAATWTMAGGYTFDYAKSRGPVAVALFDG